MRILMIGVSTAQNTTNVIPALQMKIDAFVSIETSGAHNRNWSNGMHQVLKSKGINVLDPIILNKDEDSRIDLISDKLEELFATDIKVIWNLGGGQKAQQLAMWQTFIHRVNKGFDELACYANPENHKLEIWKYNREFGKLAFSSVGIESHLSANEIFKVYGFNTSCSNSNRFYGNGKLDYSNQSTYKLLKYHQFSNYFYNLPTTSSYDLSNQTSLSKVEFLEKAHSLDDFDLKTKTKQKLEETKNLNACIEIVPMLRKEIVQQLEKLFSKEQETKTIDNLETSLVQEIERITGKVVNKMEISFANFKMLFPNFSKISFLFEQILIDKIASILIEKDNRIIEAYSNIKIYNESTQVAEYDVLLVTEWGTIIAIDAKTFEVAKKDIDARVLNLQNGAGRYIEFVAIFPFNNMDFKSNYFPRKLIPIPYELNKHKIKFYSIDDDSYIYEHNRMSFTIKSINELFDDLKIIK